MGQPVVHFEIIGKDGAAAQAFYGRTASASAAAWRAGPRGYGGHVTFYVQMDDVEAGLVNAAR